jgi:hypothetical protein
MPGEDEGIDRQRLQINGYVAGGLCTIHDKIDLVVMQEFPDTAYILHRTEDVATVGCDHEPRIRGDGRLDQIRVDRSVLEGKNRQPNAVLPFEFVQRSQNGVVVEFGCKDMKS